MLITYGDPIGTISNITHTKLINYFNFHMFSPNPIIRLEPIFVEMIPNGLNVKIPPTFALTTWTPNLPFINESLCLTCKT